LFIGKSTGKLLFASGVDQRQLLDVQSFQRGALAHDLQTAIDGFGVAGQSRWPHHQKQPVQAFQFQFADLGSGLA
jgi:hypothetical protein